MFYTKVRVETKDEIRVYEFLHELKSDSIDTDIILQSFYLVSQLNSIGEIEKIEIVESHAVNPNYCLGGQIRDK